MRTVLLSELRHNGRRAVASGLAVAICVAFVAVVLGATATMKGFLGAAAGSRAAGADVVVSVDPALHDPAQVWTPEAVERLATLPDATGAWALRSTYLDVRWPDGRAFTRAETVAPQGMRWFDVTSGRLPERAGEIAVDAGTAKGAGVRAGSRVEVADATVTVVGVVRGSGPALETDRLVLGTDADLRAWGAEYPDAVLLRGGPVLAEAVRAAAPGQATVQTAAAWTDARARDVTGEVDVLGSVVLGFTGVAVLVALIVIGNTFTILLAQRTERLALLRCVGATRRQLRRAVLVESAALGLLASLAGLLVGLGAVVLGTWAVGRWLDVARGIEPVVPAAAVAVPLAVGFLVTVGASLAPARRATRVAPLAALRPDDAVQVRRTGRVRVVLGTLLLVGGGLATAGAAALGVAGSAVLAVLAGLAGGTAVALGVVALGPVLVPRAVRLVGAPVLRLGPVGRISVENTVRNPLRASATAIALFVGVGLITVLTVGAATTQAAARDEIAAQLPVDVVVALDGADPALSQRAVAALRDVPGTAASAVLRQATVRVGDVESAVVGAPDADLRAVYRTPVDVRPGTLVASSSWAQDLGVAGDRVTLTGTRGEVALRLVPAAVEQPLVADADLDRLGAAATPVQVWLRADDAVEARTYLADVRSGLSDAQAGDVPVMGPLVDRASLEQVISVLLTIATALLGVAVLISLVGVGNTLSLSVLERRRESGLQRALGMTRRQLRASLAVEAVLLAGTGVVLGLVVGVPLGWAGSVALLGSVADVVAPVVPVGRLAAVAGVAVLAAVLASVLPARRSARVSPTEALAAT